MYDLCCVYVLYVLYVCGMHVVCVCGIYVCGDSVWLCVCVWYVCMYLCSVWYVYVGLYVLCLDVDVYSECVYVCLYVCVICGVCM